MSSYPGFDQQKVSPVKGQSAGLQTPLQRCGTQGFFQTKLIFDRRFIIYDGVMIYRLTLDESKYVPV